MKKTINSIRCVLLCLAIAPGIVLGQGQVGTLNGTILDSTGAVIPGATVVATNTATGVESRTTSTSAGAYTLPYLPAGTYTIRVTSPGFRTANQENVILRVGQVLTVNIALEVGAVTEEVTVSAAPPLLESGTAEIGRYVTTDEYNSWPIIVSDGQRQIQDFIFRSLPGATGGTFRGSINGGQNYSHEILIEGIPLGRSDLSGGNNNEMSPSAEAVGEFKLHTGAMGAQYNGGQTAVANFALKSGTNEFHGSGFYYIQNEALNAAPLSLTSRGARKTPFRQNNYGVATGGPVYIPKVYDGRNRTFVFGSIEVTDRSEFNITGFNTTLATRDMKQGNFARMLDPAFTGNSRSGSVIGTDALGRNVVFGQIYDPLSTTVGPNGNPIRDPFPGNIIPQSRFSPVSQNIIGNVGIVDPELDRMVLNTPTVGTCCPFFDLRTYMIKADHNLTDNHRISGVYNHEYRNRNNSPGGRYLPTPPGLPTQTWQNQYTPSRIVRLSLNSTVTPTVLNRFAAGYNRFRNANQSVYVDQGWAEQVGVRNTAPTHFPRMDFGGTEWQGGTIHQIGSSSAGEGANGSWIIQDDVTFIRAAHSMRFGYEHRNYYYNTRGKSGSGTFQFRPDQTMLPGYSNETGHAFASFVLGAPQSASRGVVGATTGFRHPSHAFYVMDDWKVSPKLTMNFGFRWEVIGAFNEVTDRMSMVDLNAPNPGAGNRPGALVFADRFQDTNWGQFGPRAGFAYQVNQKLVVRGGYGITNTPQIRNDWGYDAFTFGFNGVIPVLTGTSPTGFVDDPAMFLDQAYPALQGSLPNTNPAAGNFTSRATTARDSNRLPYVQNWNFTTQYELPAQTVLELAYIGSKGTRLWGRPYGNLNVLPVSFLSMGDTLRELVGSHPQYRPYDTFPNNQSVAQALKPWPQFTGVTEAYPYSVNSLYNAFQLTATRRFSNGVGILVGYTFSKTMGYNDDNGPDSFYTGAQDVYNRSLERSLAGYHLPHQLKITWIYELPIGVGRAVDLRWGNWIVGGWKLSGIHQYTSGFPVGVSQSGVNAVLGGDAPRPDVTGAEQTLGGAPANTDFFNPTPYLNPTGFAQSPRTGNGTPLRVGTAPRFLNIRGPHQASEDFRISKYFPIWEQTRIEVGASFINAFKRVGRGWASTNITSPVFGRLLSVGGGRTIEISGRIEW
ncbi:MAG: carboxypeptidase regulatory-like domain-containing protein [Bryobacteraceae bacterium]|nr:carboxypeptidase regulatory-like domain-containing protein [Bryobacteraceae bacterium]